MTVYRTAASLDVVALADDAVLLRSDVASCRLEGTSATFFADHILPLLRDWSTIDSIMRSLGGYAESDVVVILESLVRSGLIQQRSVVPPGLGIPSAGRSLAELGIDEGACAERLRKLRVGIFGLDMVGQLIADSLFAAGIGTMLLSDPGRQHSYVPRLLSGNETIIKLAPIELSRSVIEALATELDLMVVTFDRSFLIARHWVNLAALASGCPALFIDVSLVEAVIGPTVLPGETGCYMCFRMRHLATSDNFDEVMAHEQFLDAKRDPAGARPLFPGLADIAAGCATGEIIRLLFGPLIPSFANAVMVVDPIEARFKRHHVLRQPDCPHCHGIDVAVRVGG